MGFEVNDKMTPPSAISSSVKLARAAYRTARSEAASHYGKSQALSDYLAVRQQDLSMRKYWDRKKYALIDRRRVRILRRLPYLKAMAASPKTDADYSVLSAYREQARRLAVKWSIRSIMYLVLLFYVLLTVYPFVWAIFGSFRLDTDFSTSGLNPFPETFSTSAYEYLFTNPQSLFGQWVGNTFVVCVVGTVINLFLNNFAGYALARITFKGSNQLLWGMLAMIMIPAQVLLIPNYLLIKQFNLVDNIFALILPAAVNIGYIFMSRQFFIDFPKDVEEAAAIDGMSRLRMIFRVAFPLMRPLLITQSIFVFMGFWNNFLNAKVFLISPGNYTIPVGIQSLIATDVYRISYSQLLAASSLSLLPILALYAMLNHLILKGHGGYGEK